MKTSKLVKKLEKQLSKKVLSALVEAYNDGAIEFVMYGTGKMDTSPHQGLIDIDTKNFPYKYFEEKTEEKNA